MQYNNQLNVLKMLFLISGILNLITAVVWLFNTILGAVAFCGLGCMIGVLPIISTISCVLDFMVYNRLKNNNKTAIMINCLKPLNPQSNVISDVSPLNRTIQAEPKHFL